MSQQAPRPQWQRWCSWHVGVCGRARCEPAVRSRGCISSAVAHGLVADCVVWARVHVYPPLGAPFTLRIECPGWCQPARAADVRREVRKNE